MTENIILIGFMGCGKSSIGRRLAFKLKKNFIDTDHKIQNDQKMTINEIFDKYGEKYFRELETELCENMSKEGNSVVATGGGIIKNQRNVELLKKNGKILYLKATPEAIYENIKYDETRPLLKCDNKLERIKTLMQERVALYEKCADITYSVERNGIDDAVEEIIKLLGEN